MSGCLTSLESVIGEEDGGDTGGGCGGGLRDQMSLLSLFRLARTHTRHGCVEHAAYVGVGDARVAPCGVDSDAHLILIEMCGHGGASRGWWCSWGPRVGGRRF